MTPDRYLPKVTVVVLAYGVEPDLVECVEAVLTSEGVTVDLRLVDNGSSNPALATIARLPGVTLLTPGLNTGFAGGCNLALRGTESQFVALVNSDAIVRPRTLRALIDEVVRQEVGIACADVRLRDNPDLLNTAGNPVHLSGLSWPGSLGEPAVSGPVDDVASATGAVMALRTEVWRDLGGFEEMYFAYHEDVDLSLRCWGEGLRVVHVPQAVALHRYEFSRNALKFYLLERNRLITIMTVYPTSLLFRLLPVLMAFELALLPVAGRGGWLDAKLRSYVWLAVHARWLRSRRRSVQRRLRSDADLRLAAVLTPNFTAAALAVPRPLIAACNLLCRIWWSMTRPRRGKPLGVC